MKISNRLKEMPVSSVRKLSPYVQPLKERAIKIYHLNIGDPDIKTPEVMINAVRNYSDNPVRYALSAGEIPFIKALQIYYAKLGHDFITPEDIIATAGGSEAIVMTFLSICDYGDEVLVFEPFYSNYSVCAQVAGVKLIAVPTYIENGFHLPSKEEILLKITEKTKGILFCSPSNPTGTIYTQAEIELLVEIAQEKNLFLISDEVYREYAFGGAKHVSLLSYMNQMSDRTVMLDSLSKRYSICGARLGVFISLNKELMQGVIKIAQGRLSAGLIDQYMGSFLNEVPKSYIDEVQKEYEKRRDIMYEGLQTIEGVKVYKPEGAFYMMVELPIIDSDDFCLWLLTEFSSNNETVMLAPGAGFYANGKISNQVRIAYVLKEEDLKRSIAIIEEALKVYRTIKPL